MSAVQGCSSLSNSEDSECEVSEQFCLLSFSLAPTLPQSPRLPIPSVLASLNSVLAADSQPGCSDGSEKSSQSQHEQVGEEREVGEVKTREKAVGIQGERGGRGRRQRKGKGDQGSRRGSSSRQQLQQQQQRRVI
eukprot:303911-Hanusia_phi.AAC.1